MKSSPSFSVFWQRIFTLSAEIWLSFICNVLDYISADSVTKPQIFAVWLRRPGTRLFCLNDSTICTQLHGRSHAGHYLWYRGTAMMIRQTRKASQTRRSTLMTCIASVWTFIGRRRHLVVDDREINKPLTRSTASTFISAKAVMKSVVLL